MLLQRMFSLDRMAEIGISGDASKSVYSETNIAIPPKGRTRRKKRVKKSKPQNEGEEVPGSPPSQGSPYRHRSPLASPPAPTIAHPTARRPASAGLTPLNSRYSHTPSPTHTRASPHPLSSFQRYPSPSPSPPPPSSPPHTRLSPHHHHYGQHAGHFQQPSPINTQASPRPASASSTYSPPRHSPLFSPSAATTAQRPGALVASVLGQHGLTPEPELAESMAAPTSPTSAASPHTATPTTPQVWPRPRSAAPTFPGAAGRRAVTPGPSSTEDITPKYLLSNMREPELGSQPGKYVSPGPRWKPFPQEADEAPKSEPEPFLRGGRYDRVLAVPPHVLAQSFFHPDRPSSQARVKELQKELKVARDDKKVMHERAFRCENELTYVKGQLKAALQENSLARAHIAALQEQLHLCSLAARTTSSPAHSPSSSPKPRQRPHSAVLPRRLPTSSLK